MEQRKKETLLSHSFLSLFQRAFCILLTGIWADLEANFSGLVQSLEPNPVLSVEILLPHGNNTGHVAQVITAEELALLGNHRDIAVEPMQGEPH